VPFLRACAALGAAVLAAGPPLTAATIVRGPYVQRLSSAGAVIRWRTDLAVESRLWWGSAPGVHAGAAVASATTTEHRLEVTGLSPRETVFYAVGDELGVLAGGDADHRFATPRAEGDWRPVRFWVLGDSGTASPFAEAVRDGYATFAEGVPPDFWLLLGDNAYPSGTDAQYQAALFEMYPQTLRSSGLWPSIGNHDAASSDSPTQSGPYFAAFSLPRSGEAGGEPSGTEAWYAFDAGQLHVVVLDTADSSLAAGSAMLEWLDADLAANHRPWTLAAFHHPPYTKGSHDSDDPADSGGRMGAVRANVLPILEGHGVDLVLSGHSHGYERSFLIDGHYGSSDTFEGSMRLDGGDGDPDGDGAYLKSAGPHGGTVYVVAGASGSLAGTIEPHPAMAVGLEELGSLAIDVEDNRLDLYFVRTDGTVGDHLRLLDGDRVFADGFERGSDGAWSERFPPP
jgi:hypothetical protein